jgi:hypothetical protein
MINMKKTLANLFGSICFWLGVAFTSLAIYEGCLAVYCIYMLSVDHGIVDHNWNCGVIIYGFECSVESVIASLFSLLAWLLLKGEWWRRPIQHTPADASTRILTAIGALMAFMGLLRLWWCFITKSGHIGMIALVTAFICGTVGLCLFVSGTASLIRNRRKTA